MYNRQANPNSPLLTLSQPFHSPEKRRRRRWLRGQRGGGCAAAPAPETRKTTTLSISFFPLRPKRQLLQCCYDPPKWWQLRRCNPPAAASFEAATRGKEEPALENWEARADDLVMRRISEVMVSYFWLLFTYICKSAKLLRGNYSQV